MIERVMVGECRSSVDGSRRVVRSSANTPLVQDNKGEGVDGGEGYLFVEESDDWG